MSDFCKRNFTIEQMLAGLKAGRELRIDRRDAPELPELQEMEAQGLVTSRLVEVEEQYSYLAFWWTPGDHPMKYFVGRKNFDGSTSFSLMEFKPRLDTKEERLQTPVVVELSEKGQQLTLTEATDMHKAGKLVGDYIVPQGGK